MKGRPKGSKNIIFHKWSNEEKEYLKEIVEGKSYKEIQELMNEKFKYKFTISQIKGAIGRYKLNTGLTGRFESGHVPFNKGTKGLTGANKTSFKKGNKPINHRPVGSERVTVDGYIEIKVSEPSKWRLKHQVIYEQHKGKVPKGYTIIFADRNRQNFDINNLIIVSRNELLVMNKNKLIYEDKDITKTGLNIAKVIIKTTERKKNGI